MLEKKTGHPNSLKVLPLASGLSSHCRFAQGKHSWGKLEPKQSTASIHTPACRLLETTSKRFIVTLVTLFYPKLRYQRDIKTIHSCFKTTKFK